MSCYRGLNCDINVNNTMALRNTRLCRNYVDLDPRVRPLLMIIKHWAKQRALNDGIYTCMMLIVY